MAGITPYPISGVVYNIVNSVCSGAVVTATSAATGETVSVTTNTSGQYLLDLANLKGVKNSHSGYTDGDTITITATYGTNSARWRTAVSISDGSEDLNLYLLNDNFNDNARKGRSEMGTYFNNYYSINNTIKTTISVLVPPMQTMFARRSSITIKNRSALTLTSKVWVTNKPQPGTIGGNDWIQLGSDITGSDVKEWTGVYLWTAVTATANSQTNQNVDCYYLATS